MEDKNKKDINRRDFIKIVGISAATSTGLLYGCSSKGTTSASIATGEGEVPTDKMTYRTSPTTGDRVSLLGYGCMRWLISSYHSRQDRPIASCRAYPVRSLVDT